MADLLDKSEVTTVHQTDAAMYVVIGRTGTPTDQWMQPYYFHKARTGNDNVLGFLSLSAAITAIGATATTIEIPASTTVSASLTIPANVTLLFTGAGQISVASGQTLTINGAMDAPLRQVFTGVGSVKFGSRIAEDFPEWFGALGDNSTDDQAAIQKAIDAFKDTGVEHHPGRVILTGGYAIGSTILITGNSITLRGYGWGVQNDAPYRGFVRWIGSAGTPMIKITECWGSGVEYLRIIGKSSAKPTAGIEFASTNTVHGLDFSFLDHVWIGAMFGYDTDDATQFDAGILFSGTVDGDSNVFRHVSINRATIGVDCQNGNAADAHWDTLIIQQCTSVGFNAGSSINGTNWLFALNAVDINMDLNGTRLLLRHCSSEGSGRMATFAGQDCQLTVLGGSWQAGDNFTPADSGNDRWFIDASGGFTQTVHLEDFRVNVSGSTAKNPVLRIGVAGGGSSSSARLINTNLHSGNINVLTAGGFHTAATVELITNVTTAAQAQIYSRVILDPHRAEDQTFQTFRHDFLGKVNNFGGPLKVKKLFAPLNVAATTGLGSGATTYSYRVTAVTRDGETDPSTADTCTNAATLDSTHTNIVTWEQAQGAYAYRVYGRSAGTELLMITLQADQLTSGMTWTDDGSLTPSGALSVVNSTGNATVEGVLTIGTYTSTERDALTAVNGMLIYNSTTSKAQIRAGGAWVDLH